MGDSIQMNSFRIHITKYLEHNGYSVELLLLVLIPADTEYCLCKVIVVLCESPGSCGKTVKACDIKEHNGVEGREQELKGKAPALSGAGTGELTLSSGS